MFISELFIFELLDRSYQAIIQEAIDSALNATARECIERIFLDFIRRQLRELRSKVKLFYDPEEVETMAVINNKENRTIKIYHIDDPDFKFPPKDRQIRDGSGAWAYPIQYREMELPGNIITNKATRTDKKFASRFESDGLWRSELSWADFSWFAASSRASHIYIKRKLTMDEAAELDRLVMRAKPSQIIDALRERFHNGQGVDLIADGLDPYNEIRTLTLRFHNAD